MVSKKNIVIILSGGLFSVVLITTLLIFVPFSDNGMTIPDDLDWTDKPIIDGSAASFIIDEDVITPFGKYAPKIIDYTMNLVPDNEQYDLSNVKGAREVDGDLKEQLKKYGFAIVDEGYPSIYEIYPEEGRKFITTDICLHTYHVLYDFSLRILEGESFFYVFEQMLATLRINQMTLKNIVSEEIVIDSINKNIAYLSVMLKLLNDSNTIPTDFEDIVNSELANIEAGVRSPSAIFDYDEDFSQYKPRGHYTRHSILEQYFQAMMYAGRMSFLINKTVDGKNVGVEQTRMALTLISSFNSTIGNETVWDYWDRVYEPTVFYVGSSDDLTPKEYYKIWQNSGAPIGDELANNYMIKEIIEDIKEYRNPQINSMFVFDTEDVETATKGLRLLGQRFIPDSYIFQQLVYDKVVRRLMPNGLDIFSVFGSSRAEYLMQYEDEKYSNYNEQVNKLRDEFGILTEHDWSQNLYWLWLYSLFPLLNSSEEGLPGFMLNELRTIKALMTALGSWAELRHDTILYSKQSYTVEFTSVTIPSIEKGYVEPYPELYLRLSSLVNLMKDGLGSRELLLEGFDTKLTKLALLYEVLANISIKELQNEVLTYDDYVEINSAADIMYDIASFAGSNYTKWFTETDSRMALVADVHTDPNNKEVLEVAVGNPLSLYVIVKDTEGNYRLTKGGTYSYYEFKYNMNNRLTDEEWQEILDTDPPDLPLWIINYLSIFNYNKIIIAIPVKQTF
ncbi:MAG: DUF3160 domain-containing protein [Candidatus Heimdallarchaeaceae archaeon]|jgi:hypothetical protein